MLNRWFILAAGIAIQIILGGLYSWSTFEPRLREGHQLSAGACGFLFGTTIAMFTLTMTFAGRILSRRGPQITASIGAILFGCGYLLASFSGGQFWLILLGIGGLTGAGIGFGYVCPLAIGMQWFPQRKGLVTGVSVAGFGGGAILLSFTAEYFLENGTGVLTFFRWYGVVAGLIMLAASQVLREPQRQQNKRVAPAPYATLLSPRFALLATGMFVGTFGGLLVIGNLTPILLEQGKTAGFAAIAVSVFAVGNAMGRIAWGQIFDRIQCRSITLSLGTFAIGIVSLLFPSNGAVLYSGIFLLGMGFGANFVLYALAISRCYGAERFPQYYPVCFAFYGLAGLIAPGIGGRIADATGTFSGGLWLVLGVIVLATLVMARSVAFLENSNLLAIPGISTGDRKEKTRKA